MTAIKELDTSSAAAPIPEASHRPPLGSRQIDPPSSSCSPALSRTTALASPALGPAPCDPASVSLTARWAAGTRCLASQKCPAMFGNCDPYAELFAGRSGMELANSYDQEKRRIFTEHGRQTEDASMYYVASRSQVFDNLITQALGLPDRPQRGVLLGAGLDSRAWRLNFPPAFPWHELDASLDFCEKAKLTTDEPRCRQIFSSVDFADADWPLKALPPGISRDPTLWVAEGLVYYLAPAQLDNLATTLTDLSAPGSTFIFDAHNLADAAVRAETVATTVFMNFWRPRGVSYQSSQRHIEAPLARAGWDITTDSTPPHGTSFKVATLRHKKSYLLMAG